MDCVMSCCRSNEPRRLQASSAGPAIPADKKAYGYISEHHAYGETGKEAGDYAGYLAAAMPASTPGIDFNIDESWDKKNKYSRSAGK